MTITARSIARSRYVPSSPMVRLVGDVAAARRRPGKADKPPWEQGGTLNAGVRRHEAEHRQRHGAPRRSRRYTPPGYIGPTRPPFATMAHRARVAGARVSNARNAEARRAAEELARAQAEFDAELAAYEAHQAAEELAALEAHQVRTDTMPRGLLPRLRRKG